MKKIEWETSNKMKATSGCKIWDRQVNILSVGNIIANGFMGRYVRGINDMKCNGKDFPVGHLQNFDLESFDTFLNPGRRWVRVKIVAELAKLEHGGILYVYWHSNGNGKETVHGFTLTDRDHNFIKDWTTGPTYKSVTVVQYARQYVSTWTPLPHHQQMP